ncbi:unnamed protein product [Polarella glacialis]|uniref:Uncharacterized protein n=1 Tax=Polarella glacialis TaxID=89957 RepID=A0A813GIW0_POLGL|nr:unnamed protein product [Polarella glacialis]
MSHLLGLRTATAVGAHLSVHRGAGFRSRTLSVVLRLLPTEPQLLRIDSAALVRRVESVAAVPEAARRAFRLFAGNLQDASPSLNLWARVITLLAVEAHVHTHAVLQHDLERRPSIAEAPLRAPVFIVGLPRTGTTLLHHLLALDPDAQCLRAFEVMRPMRSLHDGLLPAAWADFLDWARLSLMMRLAAFVAPQWPHHHSLDASSPEECLFALQCSMPLDTHYRVRARLPEVYAGDEAIPQGAYHRYRLFLQQVQMRRGSQEQHYVLKGQLLHLQYLAQLQSAFPDARVVWTHRPAAQVVGSLCSLRRSQLAVFLKDEPVLEEVGAGVLQYLSDALTRAAAALEAEKHWGKEPLHVQYEALVQNPVAVVEQIYASWGRSVSDAHREVMERYLERSLEDRGRAGKDRAKYHDASLETYGLSKELVRSHFSSGSSSNCFADIGALFQSTGGVLRHSDLLKKQTQLQGLNL